jgi:hypothetical protein
LSPAQSSVIAGAARAHVLPEAYLWGLTDVLSESQGRPTFLLGTVYADGRWFYFPLVFLMKATLPMLLLLAASPFVARGMNTQWRFLVIPPVAYLAVSMFSGLNLGVRHILPVFPFLILIAAAAASALLGRRGRPSAVAGAVLLAAHAATSLHAFPNYLPYSNEAVGGPARTYRVMGDSNADWGQGLLQVSDYLREHDVTDCWYAYRMPGVFNYYGITCKLLPTAGDLVDAIPPRVLEGTILIGANDAIGFGWGPGELNPYKAFLDRPPDDMIGNHVLVFRGRFEAQLLEALARVRLSQRLVRSGQAEEAVREARTAVELAPASAETHGALCTVLWGLKRLEGRGSCDRARQIAQRVYPEYQYRRVAAVMTADAIIW